MSVASFTPALHIANPSRAGLALGGVLATWHALWSALVAIGWAQPILDFVFYIHFLKPAYIVQPFDPVLALTLIIVTGAIGFAIGWLFAAIWNRVSQA